MNVYPSVGKKPSFLKAKKTLLIFGMLVFVLAIGVIFGIDWERGSDDNNILALLILMGLGVLMLRWPFAILLLIFFLIPLESFTTVEGVSINRIATIMLFISWLFQHFRAKLPLQLNRGVWILAGFIAWTGISVFWANGEVWKELLPAFMLNLLLVIVAIHMINSKAKLKWAIIALLSGMFVFIAIWLATGALVRDNTFFIPSLGTGNISTYGDMLGAVIACFVALLFYTRFPTKFLVAGLMIPLSYLTIAIGLRRSILTTVFVLLALIILSRKNRFATLAFAALMIAGFLWTWSNIYTDLPVAIQARFTIDAVVDSRGSSRLDIWQLAYDVWLKYPIFGVGLGDFSLFSSMSAELMYRSLRVHNMFLEVLVETGIIGFTIWVLAWGYLILAAIEGFTHASAYEDRLLAGVCLALIMFFFSAAQVDPFPTSRLLWSSFALCLVSKQLFAGDQQPLNSVVP